MALLLKLKGTAVTAGPLAGRFFFETTRVTKQGNSSKHRAL